MPNGTVQLIYRTSHADGVKLVSDPRTAAIGYTGSRSAGLTLKQAADAAGKPIYLELSSVNPVVIMPGAITERGAAIADEYCGSCLMGAGQFCTNPGLLVLLNNADSQQFVDSLVTKFQAAKPGTLLTRRDARFLSRIGQRFCDRRSGVAVWWRKRRRSWLLV